MLLAGGISLGWCHEVHPTLWSRPGQPVENSWPPLAGTGLHPEVQDTVACLPRTLGGLCWTHGVWVLIWGASSNLLDPCPKGSLTFAMSNRHYRLRSPMWAAPLSGIHIVWQLAEHCVRRVEKMLSIPLWKKKCQLKKDAWLFGGQIFKASQSHMSEYREMRCCWLHPQKDSNPLGYFLSSPHPYERALTHADACTWFTALKAQEMLFWKEWDFKTGKVGEFHRPILGQRPQVCLSL